MGLYSAVLCSLINVPGTYEFNIGLPRTGYENWLLLSACVFYMKLFNIRFMQNYMFVCSPTL